MTNPKSAEPTTDLMADHTADPVERPHSLAVAEVTTGLASTLEGGLTSAEAAARLERFGPNKLPAGKKESALMRLLRQFHDPMIYVLIGAAVLTALLGEVVDTIVIAAVVLINATIGYLQEGKAADALEGIRNMLSLHAQVRRDGSWHTVDAEDLVPGDVVRLSAGDKVPADLRLTSTTNLQIEESALTGGGIPRRPQEPRPPWPPTPGVGDRSSMAFSGTTVVAGSAIGGGHRHRDPHRDRPHHQHAGRGGVPGDPPAGPADVAVQSDPVGHRGDHAVVMFGIAWLLYEQETIASLVMAAISFAVAAIPEGLPAVLTITLALGVQRMAKRNAITRRMNSVETLGSVTVICSDKTGTLTRNEMTVRSVVTRQARTP